MPKPELAAGAFDAERAALLALPEISGELRQLNATLGAMLVLLGDALDVGEDESAGAGDLDGGRVDRGIERPESDGL